jgi:sulfite reductase (NADPH) flavoprotein alpha-component
LGLAFCVTIAIVGVTGALYSYADDIRDYERAAYISSRKTAKPLSVEEISARFLEQKPDASIRFFSVRRLKDDLKSIGVSAAQNGAFGYYELNPYSGEIITDGLKSDKFFAGAMIFHRFLNFDGMSVVGKQIVAATTIAIIVISIAGILLYLPLLRRNFLRNLTIDFKSKGYKFLYQLHCVLGVFTLIFVLIMCFTGLWWSYGWYRGLLSSLAGVENMGFPRGERREMQIASPKELQRVVDTASEAIDGVKMYYIRVPFKDDPYELSYSNDRYGAYNLLKIDVQEGVIVSQEPYAEKTTGQKLIQNMYTLHSGQFFGEFGKAAMCLSSLAMALFSVSGAMMFYGRMRRKRRALRTPKRATSSQF